VATRGGCFGGVGHTHSMLLQLKKENKDLLCLEPLSSWWWYVAVDF
jgi:hypothetical protein